MLSSHYITFLYKIPIKYNKNKIKKFLWIYVTLICKLLSYIFNIILKTYASSKQLYIFYYLRITSPYFLLFTYILSSFENLSFFFFFKSSFGRHSSVDFFLMCLYETSSHYTNTDKFLSFLWYPNEIFHPLLRLPF